MRTFVAEEHTETYAACRSIIGPERWDKLFLGRTLSLDPASLVKDLLQTGEQGIPKYLPDLARLEYTLEDIRTGKECVPEEMNAICLNPTVRLIDLDYLHDEYFE